MQDLDRALEDISLIRSAIAAGTVFRGLGPLAVAATGLLAAAAAILQEALGPAALAPLPYFAVWTGAALLAVLLLAAEMRARSRRHHGGLADTLLLHAVARFLPAAGAGALTGLVLFRHAPETLWILPGLWQVMVALGLLAALPTLPRAVGLAGLWYLAAGLGTLVLASADHALDPWRMGLPFAAGQLLLAAILHRAREGGDG